MMRNDATADDSGNDPLQRVRDLLAAYRSGGRLQLLADATQLMVATPPRHIVDPPRAELAFALADSWLAVAVGASRLDALDAGLYLVNAELAHIPNTVGSRPAELAHIPNVGSGSAALLRTMRGALLAERYYLDHRYEDLAASLQELEQVTATVRQIPSLLNDHRRAWLWYTYGSARRRQADVTKRLDQLGQVVEALEQASAIEGAKADLRTAIRHKLVMARLDYLRRVVLSDPTAQPKLDQLLDESILELTDLADNAPGEASERATWLQNLAALRLERAARPGRSEADRDTDLTVGLAVVERGLAAAPEWDGAQVTLRGTRADILRARDG
jgi:hypothetical protein